MSLFIDFKALQEFTLIEQSLTVLLEYFKYHDTLNAVSYCNTYLQYRYIDVLIRIANH